MKRLVLAALTAALGAVPAAALSADPMVSAARADGIVAALKEAGYPAELHSEDGDERPHIDTELEGWSSEIYFLNCDEEGKTGCQSLMIRTGFDRKDAMPPEMVNEIMSNERYMSVYLDSDGDPWADWDIYLGSGIPKSVFLGAVAKYASQIDLLSEKVFAEERAADGDKDEDDEGDDPSQ